MTDGEIPYDFGCLLPLPVGYRVSWFACHEHYQGMGPHDWESPVTCDPYQARRWCFAHSQTLAGEQDDT